jgi:hypothetical protein
MSIGRANYRRGELRLILSMPEPWSETDRAKFLRAIESVANGDESVAGMAPGNVTVNAAFLATWGAPPAITEAGSIDADHIDKLIVKFGVDEPRLRADAREQGFSEGYVKGLLAGAEHPNQVDALAEQPSVRTYSDSRMRAAVPIVAPYFNLSPLPPEENCSTCGALLSECDRYGCGGAKPSGFRYGPRAPQEPNATAMGATGDPHGARSPEAVESSGFHSVESLDFAPDAPETNWEASQARVDCLDDTCLIRHTRHTPHVWVGEDLDKLIDAGKICNSDNCIDFHYLNDGSSHQVWPDNEGGRD